MNVMRDLHNLKVLTAAGMSVELAEEMLRRDDAHGLAEQRQIESIMAAWAKAGCVPGLLEVSHGKD